MSAQPLDGRCGAQLRGKPGRFCEQYPLEGRTRCKLHGGATPRGMASAAWRGRGYSQDLPAVFRDKLAYVRQDDQASSLLEEILVTRTRALELIESLQDETRLTSAEAEQEIWEGYTAIARELAAAEPDHECLRQGLDRVREGLEDKRHARQVWDEYNAQVERLRKLCETESRRELGREAALSVNQAKLLVGEIADLILEEFQDDKPRLAAFIKKFNQRLQVAEARRIVATSKTDV